MFFADRVPREAREAYSKDAMAGILGASMMGMTLPFVIVIARKTLHATPLEIGFLLMAPVAGNLLSLAWANMTQGRRKMPYAVWPWIIARSLFFLVIFATCSKVFVAIYVVFWLISSAANPAYTELMKEIYPDSDRGKIMGYARVLTSVASTVLALIAGWGLKYVSYRYVFPFAALFGVASCFVFRRIRATEATGSAGVPLLPYVWDSIVMLYRDKGFSWFCAGIFLFGFANFFCSPACALYEIDVLHVATVRTGIFSFVASVCAMAGYFYWGSHLDRRRPEKVVALQALVWMLIPLTYLLAKQWWVLMPAKVLGGFVGAGCDLAYFMGVLHFAPRERLAQYQAIFLTSMGIRGIAGPWLGAKVLEWGVLSMHGVFVVSAVLMLVSVVVQVAGYRRYKPLTFSHDQQGGRST